jgi:hypothetical protein
VTGGAPGRVAALRAANPDAPLLALSIDGFMVASRRA